jgi:SEC-C motif
MAYKFQLPDSVKSLDPDTGLLCITVYWRPRPDDPDPEMPGEKLSALSFLPLTSRDACLCGSGKLFRDCCQLKPYRQVVCPNPGLRQGYDLLAPQTAIFTYVDGDALGPKFMDEERLYCLENTRARAFWTYWGDPSLRAPFGTLCFGDFELLEAHTLVVTALTNKRMQTLLDLLDELAGDLLGIPQITHDPLEPVKKPMRRSKALPTESRQL